MIYGGNRVIPEAKNRNHVKHMKQIINSVEVFGVLIGLLPFQRTSVESRYKFQEQSNHEIFKGTRGGKIAHIRLSFEASFVK